MNLQILLTFENSRTLQPLYGILTVWIRLCLKLNRFEVKQNRESTKSGLTVCINVLMLHIGLRKRSHKIYLHMVRVRGLKNHRFLCYVIKVCPFQSWYLKITTFSRNHAFSMWPKTQTLWAQSGYDTKIYSNSFHRRHCCTPDSRLYILDGLECS